MVGSRLIRKTRSHSSKYQEVAYFCTGPLRQDADKDWDPHFVSEFIRLRQITFPKMDGMDDEAIAASDLGAIWA